MQATQTKPTRIARRVATPAVWNLAARLVRSLTNGARLKGSGPRFYRREGFPEIELYQIIAGRKDRFDGL